MSEYLRPSTLPEALQALSHGGFRTIAGCTDVFPATENKGLIGKVIDITNIDSLRGISIDKDGLWIGATTTWTDLICAKLPESLAGLKLAAREVGAQQIQNRGTLGGNLCNASPAADGVPPLLTLDAQVELCSIRGVRQLPVSDFIQGARKIDLMRDEILTRIFVPKHALQGSGHFRKLGARKYLVISIAMTAARIELKDGLISRAAIAVGSCGPMATRLPLLERALIGQNPSDPARVSKDFLTDLSPIADIRADAEYRLTSVLELVRRMIAEVATQVPKVA
ncbi:MAG: xanthine dehydrogenase family protein subunit M [Paracoccaceae bacterium]